MLNLLAPGKAGGGGGGGATRSKKPEARVQGLLTTRRKSGNLGDGMGKTQKS